MIRYDMPGSNWMTFAPLISPKYCIISSITMYRSKGMELSDEVDVKFFA